MPRSEESSQRAAPIDRALCGSGESADLFTIDGHVTGLSRLGHQPRRATAPSRTRGVRAPQTETAMRHGRVGLASGIAAGLVLVNAGWGRSAGGSAQPARSRAAGGGPSGSPYV